MDSRDTVLDAFVTIDTTVLGYPAIGTETRLLVASRGDTLDARAVMRFDTLVQNFTRGGKDSTIYTLDSAAVNILLDTTGTKATQPVTIELYDVDTTAVDTAVSTALSLFRPDRLIGSKTYAATDLKDSLHVPEAELQQVRNTDLWTPIIDDSKASLGDLRAIARYDFKPERFQQLKCPVLLQVGSESLRDLYVTDALAASLPDARIEALVGQAHEGMTTAPEQYAASVIRFLLNSG